MKWVRLRATKNEIEANMIRHKLDEGKIPCQLFNITSSRMFAELNEYSLGVAGNDIRILNGDSFIKIG